MIKIVLNTKPMDTEYRGYTINRHPDGSCEVYYRGEYLINEDGVAEAKALIDEIRAEQYL